MPANPYVFPQPPWRVPATPNAFPPPPGAVPPRPDAFFPHPTTHHTQGTCGQCVPATASVSSAALLALTLSPRGACGALPPLFCGATSGPLSATLHVAQPCSAGLHGCPCLPAVLAAWPAAAVLPCAAGVPVRARLALSAALPPGCQLLARHCTDGYLPVVTAAAAARPAAQAAGGVLTTPGLAASEGCELSIEFEVPSAPGRVYFEVVEVSSGRLGGAGAQLLLPVDAADAAAELLRLQARSRSGAAVGATTAPVYGESGAAAAQHPMLSDIGALLDAAAVDARFGQHACSARETACARHTLQCICAATGLVATNAMLAMLPERLRPCGPGPQHLGAQTTALALTGAAAHPCCATMHSHHADGHSRRVDRRSRRTDGRWRRTAAAWPGRAAVRSSCAAGRRGGACAARGFPAAVLMRWRRPRRSAWLPCCLADAMAAPTALGLELRCSCIHGPLRRGAARGMLSGQYLGSDGAASGGRRAIGRLVASSLPRTRGLFGIMILKSITPVGSAAARLLFCFWGGRGACSMTHRMRIACRGAGRQRCSRVCRKLNHHVTLLGMGARDRSQGCVHIRCSALPVVSAPLPLLSARAATQPNTLP